MQTASMEPIEAKGEYAKPPSREGAPAADNLVCIRFSIFLFLFSPLHLLKKPQANPFLYPMSHPLVAKSKHRTLSSWKRTALTSMKRCCRGSNREFRCQVILLKCGAWNTPIS